MLTTEQIVAREGKLTASRVGVLMNGGDAERLNLWREMVGDPGFVPEDLSDNFQVQLGAWTEPLNLKWFRKKHGPISREGEVVIHANDWAAATLDGWWDQGKCPIECKHTGGREPFETIVERYQPQMHWQMFVTGADQCALSVIMGTSDPIVEVIKADLPYAAELFKRAEQFMRFVWDMEAPCSLPPIAAPADAKKVVDMTGNNTWASNAATWLLCRDSAKDFKGAEKALKETVEADVARAFGHGIEIKRNRAGSLAIKEKS